MVRWKKSLHTRGCRALTWH